ncbi:MAG: hypothetical protein F6J97_06320 [Leptolyngbya sp. SIO4C1]|nr:hypothetical protein [Leptolyngbya sp. SIO4C1]
MPAIPTNVDVTRKNQAVDSLISTHGNASRDSLGKTGISALFGNRQAERLLDLLYQALR